MGQQTSLQSAQLNQAHASLQQAISWYSSFRRHGNFPPSDRLQAEVKTDLQYLKNDLERLDRQAIRISTVGLVSCGK